jgi:FkbM family methyltransferase
MKKNTTNNWLSALEKISGSTRISRFTQNPWKYLTAMAIKKIYFPLFHKSIPVTIPTFFGFKLKVNLPSGTDIYLTGTKTHPSELRLSKFLIQHLQPGQNFADIGAHFGFYSLLAKALIRESGRIISLEASPQTFKILLANTHHFPQILPLNLAVGGTSEYLNFYQYKGPYSEYNSFLPSHHIPEKYCDDTVSIQAQTLTDIFEKYKFQPNFIKIDVEGTEDSVISGLIPHFKINKPIIIMEYHSDLPHKNASMLLLKNNFSMNLIDGEGLPQKITYPLEFMAEKKDDSDNIVFLPL